MTTARQQHWEGVYAAKAYTEVSWYQPMPERSVQLILRTGVDRDDPIIDIGGGASTLIDHLLDEGFSDTTVLDISNAAFEQARKRLGPRAAAVEWIVSDVMQFEPRREYRLWHDRAVLHFLTDASDREHYVEILRRAIAPAGHFVLATFGPDGPLKCSGLEIRRYDIGMVQELLGPEFELQHHELEDHKTPTGATQQFLYSCWTRRAL